MAALTFNDLVGATANHMLLVNAGLANIGSGYSGTDDAKNSPDYVKKMVKAGLASVLGDIMHKNKSLVAQFLSETGVQALTAGQLILTTAVVSGEIAACRISYDGTVFEAASVDSADAIRRRRKLSNRLLVPLYSYAIEGKRLFSSGTHADIAYLPGTFGDAGTEVIPAGLFFAAMAEALSMLYGQKASDVGTAAARYYEDKKRWYIQLYLNGAVEYQPMEPYKGA